MNKTSIPQTQAQNSKKDSKELIEVSSLGKALEDLRNWIDFEIEKVDVSLDIDFSKVHRLRALAVLDRVSEVVNIPSDFELEYADSGEVISREDSLIAWVIRLQDLVWKVIANALDPRTRKEYIKFRRKRFVDKENYMTYRTLVVKQALDLLRKQGVDKQIIRVIEKVTRVSSK